MTTLRIIGIFLLLAVCTVVLLPLTNLGAVYGVITGCILLALFPPSVETLMAVEFVEGSKQ